MKDQQETLTREQLFEFVWSKPISELERTHGFADGSLAKLCARHRVPTPPRGYWTRVRAGETPSRARLPRSTDETPIELPNVHDRSDEQRDADADRISVPERLSAPIAVVAQARDALRDVQEDESGMLKCPNGCMQLRVSRKTLSYALRVADALFKACESRGWSVRGEGERVLVTIDTVSIAVAIEEGLDRTEAPLERRSGYTFQYNRNNTYIYRPSGQLSVGIAPTRHLYQCGTRRNWRGTEGRPVEGKLVSVLHGMQRLAEAVRADIEEEARRRQAEAEQARAAELARLERERAQRAIAEEKARVTYLLEQSDRWQRSVALRAFLDAARQHGAPGKLDLHGKDLAAWIDWASHQADQLDPFVPGPNAASTAAQT